MRISVEDIKRRKAFSDNRQYGIQNYDTDNSYPQNIIDIVNNSGIAKACISTFSNYVYGSGLNKEVIVNRKGQDINDVYMSHCQDYARFYGFAMHFNYNLLGDIVEINYIPFEYCRLTLNDDTEYYGKVAVYRDWNRQKKRSIRKADVDYIDVFNSDPEIVKYQMELAGGISKYKGQVLYVSNNNNQYPLAPIDPVIEDAETIGEIKVFKYKNVTSGFMANTIFVHKGKFENERQRMDFRNTLKQFQGANGSKFMMVDVDNDEQVPEIKEISTPNNDKIFELTERTVKENIIQNFKQPPLLLGVYQAGKLGATSELKEAQDYYNYMTEQDRHFMMSWYNVVTMRFVKPFEVDVFKIKPFEIDTSNGEPSNI